MNKTKKKSNRYILLLAAKAFEDQVKVPMSRVEEAKPTTIEELVPLIDAKVATFDDRKLLYLKQPVVDEGHILFDNRAQLMHRVLIWCKSHSWLQTMDVDDATLHVYNYTEPKPVTETVRVAFAAIIEAPKVTKIVVRKRTMIRINIED